MEEAFIFFLCPSSHRTGKKKSVFDDFQKIRLSYYELLTKDNNRTLNSKEGLNNVLTISPVLCFITFLSMITFADAGYYGSCMGTSGI